MYLGPEPLLLIQIVGRLLNLNGIKFYSTKEVKDEFGDAPALRWTIGQGQALPGLEEGMMGMRKGSLRKIIVPPAMGYAAGPNLLPQPSAAGRPSLDSVLKVTSDSAATPFPSPSPSPSLILHRYAMPCIISCFHAASSASSWHWFPLLSQPQTLNAQTLES